MIDLVKLLLMAGDGGHGRVSFRREKYVPKGGPDGGNGGKGGSVVLRAVDGTSTLQRFVGSKRFQAQAGEPGGKRKKTGADGENLVLEVPVGTLVWLLDENQASTDRRQHRDREGDIYRQKLDQYFLEKEGERIPSREADGVMLQESDFSVKNLDLKSLQKEMLASLDKPGQEVVVCRGGRGGKGNDAFKSASNTTPLQAEYGGPGEQKLVLLELKLLADVGLVGFPNAGKSSLLSVLSAARPEVASYPFTTLKPNLGVVELSDGAQGSTPFSAVMADIPGIIELAHEGKGLGYDFLRHIEQCRVLLYVLSLSEEEVFGSDGQPKPDDQLLLLLEKQHRSLQAELRQYEADLVDKPSMICINKSDLYSESLIRAIGKNWPDGLIVSAATSQGLDQLKKRLRSLLARDLSPEE